MKYTYLVLSDYLKEENIRSVMAQRPHMEQAKDDATKVDFFYVDGKHYYKPEHQKISSLMKNIVNDGKKAITLKSKLAKLTEKSNYVPETHIVRSNSPEKVQEKFIGIPFIFKPDKGYAGSGIKIVSTYEEMVSHLKENSTSTDETWVLQKYITEPDLIEDYKYHIRVLFLIRDDGAVYVFTKMPVHLATKPWTDNYDDSEIHITNFSEKQKPLYVDQLEMGEVISDKIESIIKDISSKVKIGCYHESNNCYEIFGADFVVDNNKEVYLIEVNSKIGLRGFYEFNETLLHSSLAVTFDKLANYKADRKSVFFKRLYLVPLKKKPKAKFRKSLAAVVSKLNPPKETVEAIPEAEAGPAPETEAEAGPAPETEAEAEGEGEAEAGPSHLEYPTIESNPNSGPDTGIDQICREILEGDREIEKKEVIDLLKKYYPKSPKLKKAHILSPKMLVKELCKEYKLKQK